MDTKNISTFSIVSQNIPWISVKSMIKKWKEYGQCVYVPWAGWRRLARDATKIPMTTLKELKASAAEMREALHNLHLGHLADAYVQSDLQ